jgi:hypothetical protein
MQDLHNSTTTLNALTSSTISTNTTTVGEIIDRANFEAVEFVIHTGTVTDGTYTPLIEHGADPALSDAAAVPDNQLLGTELGAQVVAADDDNGSNKIGYVGDLRYVRLSLVSAGVTTGGTAMSAIAVLGHPAHRSEPV